MAGTTVKTTLIAVIGSIVVAIITTLGTIWTSSTQLHKNSVEILENKDKLKGIKIDAAAFKLPVGTVVASLLDPAEFAKEVGDPETFDIKASKWTLADGKSVSGTRWATLRGNAPVPNLCGVFLRGKNNGKRTDVKEIELGQFTPDTVGPHDHNVRFYDPTGTAHGASILWDGGKGFKVEKNSDFVQGVVTSDSLPETSPKNITVNYFLRIND
jgi:hypothetical protein